MRGVEFGLCGLALLRNFGTGAGLETFSMCLAGYEQRHDKGQGMEQRS